MAYINYQIPHNAAYILHIYRSNNISQKSLLLGNTERGSTGRMTLPIVAFWVLTICVLSGADDIKGGGDPITLTFCSHDTAQSFDKRDYAAELTMRERLDGSFYVIDW